MDPFYTFLVFTVVLILEQLAGQRWLKGYYLFGLPIFITQRNMGQLTHTADIAQALEQVIQEKPRQITLRFRVLNERVIAIREALFENRAGFRYFPVMHTVLQTQPEKRQLQLIGYLNWYVLVALVYLVYRAATEPGFIPVAILILFVLIISYAAQAGINRQIVEEAAKVQTNG